MVDAEAADCGRLAQSSARGRSVPQTLSPPTTATGLFGDRSGARRAGGWKVCLALFMRLLLVQPDQQSLVARTWILDGRYLTKCLSGQLSRQVEALGGGGFQGFEVGLDGG